MATFWVHFSILSNSGTGDANMSSLFQAGLIGNDLFSNPVEIAYGSKVTIKSSTRGGGLLHSHKDLYPSGSKQQQVTCYHHKVFYFKKRTRTITLKLKKHGDL